MYVKIPVQYTSSTARGWDWTPRSKPPLSAPPCSPSPNPSRKFGPGAVDNFLFRIFLFFFIVVSFAVYAGFQFLGIQSESLPSVPVRP